MVDYTLESTGRWLGIEAALGTLFPSEPTFWLRKANQEPWKKNIVEILNFVRAAVYAHVLCDERPLNPSCQIEKSTFILDGILFHRDM